MDNGVPDETDNFGGGNKYAGEGGCRGPVIYVGGRPKGVALGGNLKVETVNASMGEGCRDNTVGVGGGGNARRTHLGNNGTPPKGERGLLEYWVGGSDVEGMRGGDDCNNQEGGGVS